jgi:hypothetical protein
MVSNNSGVTEQQPEPRQGSASLRHRIARALLGQEWAIVPASGSTSVTGFSTGKFKEWELSFYPVSRDRKELYADLEEMDNTVPEVGTALDILSDEAVHTEDLHDNRSYEVFYQGNQPAGARAIIESTLERIGAKKKGYQIAREMLKYGDAFYQLVFDDDLNLIRLMWMPPATMRRNEDELGLLKRGNEKGEFAFEQYTVDTQKFVAGFMAWQMLHLRWNHTGSSPYGRAVFYGARDPYKKLRAMEEALVINWLTRAFARLLFILDVTGMEGKAAEAYIDEFKKKLESKKIASGVLGDEVLSVVKDIYIGRGWKDVGGGKPLESLNDVEVLDTSTTGFWNLNPIEYFQNKLFIACRVPKAYMGMERDVNAKATLQQQERRYGRAVRMIQWKLTDGLMDAVNLQLLVLGYDPRRVRWGLKWPNPSRVDELDQSRIRWNNARADKMYMELGVYDAEYVASVRGVPDEVINRVQAAATQQAEPEEGAEDA